MNNTSVTYLMGIPDGQIIHCYMLVKSETSHIILRESNLAWHYIIKRRKRIYTHLHLFWQTDSGSSCRRCKICQNRSISPADFTPQSNFNKRNYTWKGQGKERGNGNENEKRKRRKKAKSYTKFLVNAFSEYAHLKSKNQR